MRPLLAAVLLSVVLPAPAVAAPERYEYRKIVMGTQARIVLYADGEERARDAAAAAFGRMEALDEVLSDWRGDSELARLSAAAGSGARPIGDDLFAVLDRAQAIARKSAGAFDVTVGPYVALWRAAREAGVLPAPDALAAARARVGFEKLRLDAEGRTATLETAGMALDLGGIGKGFAGDAALAVLRERGIERALVDLGGDLVAGEAPPGRDGWRVDAGCGAATRPHRLANGAIATSGATEQSVVVDGVRYSHIVDPRTGLGLTAPLCVSVRAADGATADALASAASVLGRRAGRALARSFGAEIQVIDPRFTPAFPAGETAASEPSEPTTPAEPATPAESTTPATPADAVESDPSGANESSDREAAPEAGAGGDGVAPPGSETSAPRAAGGAADGAPAIAGWSAEGGARFAVEGGVLTARLGEDGAGGRLRSAAPFTAFALALEVRLTGALEVGLLARETGDGRGIEVALDSRGDGAIGAVRSGSESWANDAARERFRDGEWNHLELRVTGFDPRIEVWLEGEKISDVRPARDGAAFAPCGPIAFVVRGGEVGATFEARDVVWRPLPVFAEDVRFAPLFSGRDLSGWEISDEAVDGYRAVDGRLELLNVAGAGYLRTVDDHRDFRLRLDFRMAPRTNGGVFLRAARNGENPAFSGCEVQILDDAFWAEAAEAGLEPTQRHGALYGSVAPGVDAARPIGEWNTLEVLYHGPRLAVALNGRALYDVDTRAVPGKPFTERAPRGFLGLQRTGSRDVESEVVLAFRRIEIAPIEEE